MKILSYSLHQSSVPNEDSLGLYNTSHDFSNNDLEVTDSIFDRERVNLGSSMDQATELADRQGSQDEVV